MTCLAQCAFSEKHNGKKNRKKESFLPGFLYLNGLSFIGCALSFTNTDFSFLIFYPQPIPFTADTLLGSFLKLPDGSILVGGKEATSCGLNPYSGKVRLFFKGVLKL